MYKVLPIEGGWSVFWIACPNAEPRLVPHTDKLRKVVPYIHRQAAYRRCKQLNDQIVGVCSVCSDPADIECKIGTCAPGTKYCAYHYAQAHLPIEERDELSPLTEDEQRMYDAHIIP